MNILREDFKKVGKESLFLHVGDNVPRLGEGSFIRLNDNSIMFAYTSFKEFGDHCPADIVAVISYDEGESWSEPRTLLKHDEKARNLMCPTLLRLQNGRLVGAVTHVLVDDCTRGYGIFAENMLETAQSVSKQQLKQAS